MENSSQPISWIDFILILHQKKNQQQNNNKKKNLTRKNMTMNLDCPTGQEGQHMWKQWLKRNQTGKNLFIYHKQMKWRILSVKKVDAHHY